MNWIATITDSLSSLATTAGSVFFATLITVVNPVPGVDTNPRYYWFEDPCMHTPNGDTIVASSGGTGTGCWIQTYPFQINADWSASAGLSQIMNKPVLSPVATSGTFASLTGKPTTLTGYGITDAYPLSGNPSAFLTSITSGQVVGALGYTPYSATNPSGFVNQAGARSAISLTTTGSGAATYNQTTGELNVPTPASSPSRSFANPARTLNSAFQISTTRDAQVVYTIDISVTSLLLAGQSGRVILEYADNAGMTTNVVTVSSSPNATGGVLNVTNLGSGNVTGMIPAGKYVRIRTQNVSGTPTFTFQSAQEVLL